MDAIWNYVDHSSNMGTDILLYGHVLPNMDPSFDLEINILLHSSPKETQL